MSEQEILFSTTSVAPKSSGWEPYVVLPENFDTFSNILSILSDDGELRTHPPTTTTTTTSTSNKINMPAVQTGESPFSHKKTTIGNESSHDHPRIQEGRIEDEGTRAKTRRLKKRCSRLHTSSERKRRNRLREKLSALKELLADTTSKFDQAALLDEAASRIRSLHSQLQTLSMSVGRRHSPFGGYQSASGFVGQGIGIEPGMRFQVPYIPFQMAAPFATCFVPSMLIPRLDSTFITTNPIPGESTGHQTLLPSTFLNSHPGITQHGVWEPSTNEALLGPTLGSLTGTGAGVGGAGTLFSSGVSKFPSTVPLSGIHLSSPT